LRRARQRPREQCVALLHRRRIAQDDQVRRCAGGGPALAHAARRIRRHAHQARRPAHRGGGGGGGVDQGRQRHAVRRFRARPREMSRAAVERLLVAKGLRAFVDGYVSLLLPVYLLDLGYNALQVGVIATATLLGSGVLALGIGLHAYRFHYRTLLLAASMLMAATGAGFALVTDFWPLLVIAIVGTLNPSSGDVSVFLPLEHAVLSRVVADEERTATFARYSLVGSLVAAAGSLAAGVPGVAAA